MRRLPIGVRRHLFVLMAYTILSILLSWPLIAQITTHVPGVPQWAFDESTFVWNIWYFKHALIDSLQSPLHSELIWFPLGIDLILYTYNFYHVLAAMPLALAVNLPFASNVMLLASTVLSGYGTWLLVSYLLKRLEIGDWRLGYRAVSASQSPISNLQSPVFLAAFVAGLVYAFASNRAVYAALGHYDMVTTQWIPFYALALLRIFDPQLSAARQRHWAVLGGVFFALTGLAEMISALFLAMFTVIVVLVRVRDWRLEIKRLEIRGEGQSADHAIQSPNRSITQSPISNLQSPVSNFLLLGLVAFLVWSPALIPIVQTFFSADYDLQGWGDALMLSTDLLGWFTATAFHPIFGSDVVRELRLVQQRAANPELTGFRDINTVFLGWMTLALALVGAMAFWRKVRIWVWTSVVFGVLTLGPLLQINGRYRFDLDGLETTVPLPFAVLHFIPIIKANRAPNRNSVLLMLGIAVLVGYGLYWLLERMRQGKLTINAHWLRPALAGVLAIAIVFEHLALPLPLSDARVPAVYDAIAAEPGDFTIMQLPLGWRDSFGVFGPEKTLLQYYQTAHGKAMLGGNISRAPDFKMGYFKRIPYLHALTEVQFGRPVAPEVIEAAAAQADDLMYLYDTRYVLLLPPIPDRPPYIDTWQDTWDFVKRTLPLEPAPFWAEDGIEAYRVIQPAGGDQFYLNLGEAGTFPYRGEGWDVAEVDSPYGESAVWATGRSSRLFVPLRRVDPDATYLIQIRAHPFTYPGGPAQQVGLTVNSHRLDVQPLPDGWQEVTWRVPGALLESGLNRLELTWDHAAAPRQVIPGDRTIGATGVKLPVDADLKAFADGGFIALFDEEGVQSDGSAGRRGVNITVLDRRSGRVLNKIGFDTTASEAESERLVQFVEEIPEGAPVLVVTYGEATNYLGEEAVQALNTIGAALQLDEVRGQHFAIVGVKGAESGAAAQVIDANDAFLRVSLNRDRRPLAAAVDWVQIGR
ncbi:MAG: interleukin-like EMT inducer domain-containing protein [Caldilinea sp.]